ncbi:MAG: T9SS type A sorting domain-containing protein [Bacteroidetes bacterium]|nr:T9SS type A sorting domain-containing protein [Bacteroidota bacterium]
MKRAIYILLFSLANLCGYAQCIDSTQIKPYFQGCPRTLYHPVCACNVTYFNDCIATNEYGVRYGSFTDGVCSSFDFSFFPNQLASGTSDKINFYIQFKNQENNLAYLTIIDIFGAAIYRRNIQIPFNTDNFTIDESSQFRTGVYFVIVESKGIYQIKKMVVVKAG